MEAEENRRLSSHRLTSSYPVSNCSVISFWLKVAKISLFHLPAKNPQPKESNCTPDPPPPRQDKSNSGLLSKLGAEQQVGQLCCLHLAFKHSQFTSTGHSPLVQSSRTHSQFLDSTCQQLPKSSHTLHLDFSKLSSLSLCCKKGPPPEERSSCLTSSWMYVESFDCLPKAGSQGGESRDITNSNVLSPYSVRVKDKETSTKGLKGIFPESHIH